MRLLLLVVAALLTAGDVNAIGPAPSLSIYGARPWGYCGQSVTAGDFDNDGLNDVAVMSPYLAPGDTASVEIVWGGPSVPAIVDLANYTAFTRILLPSSFMSWYYSTASGDLNGDGIVDLVVNSSPYVGIVWGGQEFPAHSPLYGGSLSVTRLVPAASEDFGQAMTVGDIDGDDYDDVIISDPPRDRVYVVHGAAALPAIVGIPDSVVTVTTIVETQAEWTYTGLSLAVGDVDRDGKGDLLIASSSGDGAKATLIPGANLEPGGTFQLVRHQGNTTRFIGESGPDDWLAQAVAIADVDGDATPDVILTAPTATNGDQWSCGATYVVYGGEPWDDIVSVLSGETPVTTIWGAGVDARYGWTCASGDVDGDLLSEVMLTPDDNSRVAVVSPGWTRPMTILVEDLDPGSVIMSPQAGSDFGRALLVSDLDGDGIGDLFVGAPWFDPPGRNSAGAVFVYSGERPLGSSVRDRTPPVPVVRVLIHPNPFSGSTTVSVTRAAGVEWVGVYDVTGRRVARIRLPASGETRSAEWDGTDERGTRLPSGMYFAKPHPAGRFVGGQMLLVR